MDWSVVRDAVEQATGTRPGDAPHPVHGGCINETYRLGDFFVKVNAPNCDALFAAERRGLETLLRSRAVRIPQPICAGCNATQAFLVLEYLPLAGRSPVSDETLGRQPLPHPQPRRPLRRSLRPPGAGHDQGPRAHPALTARPRQASAERRAIWKWSVGSRRAGGALPAGWPRPPCPGRTSTPRPAGDLRA